MSVVWVEGVYTEWSQYVCCLSRGRIYRIFLLSETRKYIQNYSNMSVVRENGGYKEWYITLFMSLKFGTVFMYFYRMAPICLSSVAVFREEIEAPSTWVSWENSITLYCHWSNLWERQVISLQSRLLGLSECRLREEGLYTEWHNTYICWSVEIQSDLKTKCVYKADVQYIECPLITGRRKST